MSVNKILQVIGSGSVGGGTTAVLSLATSLASRGVTVAVATQRSSYLAGEARAAGIRTFELDFSERRNSARVAWSLSRILDGLGGAVIHAHGARAGLPAALVPRAKRLALVYTVHGFHYSCKPFGVRHLALATERFCVRRSSATVFVAAGDQQIALAANIAEPNGHHTVIYNGARPMPILPGPDAKAYDIAFLGRLHYDKNPLMLPEILLALHPLRPTICIIGGGEYEGQLRTRVAEAGLDSQFTFLGEQRHADALALLARARMLLLPSRSEGLPIAVIEAMHRGLPVVASKLPGTSELIIDGETGCLVPPDDVAGFAAALRGVLCDTARCRKMGDAAIERALAQFSLEQNIARHLALYGELVDTTRRLRVAS